MPTFSFNHWVIIGLLLLLCAALFALAVNREGELSDRDMFD
jgi:hypothetical protein